MAITIEECWDSPQFQLGFNGEQSGATRTYMIMGTEDYDQAVTSFLNFVDERFRTWVLKDTDIHRVARTAWEAVVSYGHLTRNNNVNLEQWPMPSFQFEISGSQQKFLHSLRTIGIYSPPDRRAPYFGGLIGVTKDSVEGVDLDVAVSTFSETHYFPQEFVTTNYISFINRAYGRVNGYPFRGFAPDEVRFLGVSGSYKGNEHWVELTYRFAVSPNMDGIWVGDIGPIWKPGWAYLWVRYEDQTDNNAGSLVKRPVGVYVEQVYPYLNFASLGIGW